MSENMQKSSLWIRVIRAPVQAWRELTAGFVKALVGMRNRWRKIRRVRIDYVVLPLGGALPERSAPQRGFIQRRLPFPAPAESLQQLNSRLQKIADADNVYGVLFIFRGFQSGLATLQNVRRSILRLRESGKQVAVFTPYLDTRHFYVASAADRIIVPPGSQFEVLGLHAEVVFLKDALQQVGVQMDVVQISPYKTAFDMMQHADMTPEYREQLQWLLDDQFDMLTGEMAQGRSISQEEMQRHIDEAMFFAPEALERGLIDDVAYEDELSYLLANGESGKEEERSTGQDEESSDQHDRPKAKLRTWDQSRKALSEKYYRRTRPFIGVVSLEGLIVMGPSRSSPLGLPIPFVGGSTAGEQTVVGLLREVEKLTNMAALIFHVDSGGGSALASDLIARQIAHLGERIPVLVYMGNVAASGGYYVSAQAKHIMSQRATLTGSIGVIAARASTQALYEKVKVNQVSIQKGKRANLYSDLAPLSIEERQIFWDSIVHTYEDFKRIVAQGRDLPFEDLDAICEGRVWTGRQAETHKLVDSHGDFIDAVEEAATMAALEFEHAGQIRVANLMNKNDDYVLPRPNETVQEISRLLSREWVKELNGRPLTLMPFSLDLD